MRLQAAQQFAARPPVAGLPLLALGGGVADHFVAAEAQKFEGALVQVEVAPCGERGNNDRQGAGMKYLREAGFGEVHLRLGGFTLGDFLPQLNVRRAQLGGARLDALAEFRQEVAQLVLPPPRPQRRAGHRDERRAADGTLQDRHGPALAQRADNGEGLRAHVRAGDEEQQRQIRPGGLLAQKRRERF